MYRTLPSTSVSRRLSTWILRVWVVGVCAATKKGFFLSVRGRLDFFNFFSIWYLTDRVGGGGGCCSRKAMLAVFVFKFRIYYAGFLNPVRPKRHVVALLFSVVGFGFGVGVADFEGWLFCWAQMERKRGFYVRLRRSKIFQRSLLGAGDLSDWVSKRSGNEKEEASLSKTS